MNGKKLRFIILITFLVTFVLSRAITYFFVFGPPHIYISINGVHIHHLALGIVLLAIVGYSSLILESSKTKRIIAVFYGIGLALTFDEFGMWLHLRDNYWIRQSYDAIIIITALLLNSILFGKLWLRFFRKLFKLNKLAPASKLIPKA